GVVIGKQLVQVALGAAEGLRDRVDVERWVAEMRVDISQDLEHFDAARGLECAAVRVTALGDERQLDQVEQRLADEPAAYRAERIDLADGRDEAAVQDPIRPGERAVRSQQMLVPALMAVAAQA